MNPLKLTSNLCLALGIATLMSCGNDDSATPAPTPNPNPTGGTAAKTFPNLTFNREKAYFATDGTMAAPVDSNQAMTMTSKIDITFIYDYDYSGPGFFDPVARSQEWYWDQFEQPWLSTGKETRYYGTALTKAQFDSAATDQAKIATYFAQPSVALAPHAIWPTGSAIGGRETSNPTSIPLAKGRVFGFMNVASGKRGLLYIRQDQGVGWPHPVLSFDTKVDIIREN